MSFKSISGKFPFVWLCTCSATKLLAQHSLLSRQSGVILDNACKIMHLGRYSFHTSAFVFKRRKTREEKQYKNIIQFKPKPKFPVCELWPGITVTEISKQTSRNLNAVFEAMTYVVKQLPDRNPNAEIHGREILYELAKKLGYRVEIIKNPNDVQQEGLKMKSDIFRRPKPDVKDLVKRSPVVTIMGHVDHGKTTLLDSLRNTSVTAQEHGGITQHIGAFVVKTPEGDITFLDTPGHAAFQAMRSRGAHATDIVVLVVAADDSVMEQTLESVRFAREAKVPIIVAINKIDKPQANPEQVKKDLLKCGLQLEELGGDVQAVCISALKKLHLNELIEAILTQAEIMEISGDPTGPVEGIVLETSVDAGKGKLSTALIQRGTLKKGAILVAGTSWAKVRAIYNDQGKTLSMATPGTPVQIAGWRSLPIASDVILEAKSEKHAHDVIQYRETLKEYEQSQQESKVIQQKIDQHIQQYQAERQDRLMRGRFRKDRISVREKEIVFDSTPSVGFVLKGDVHGSVEAIVDVLSTYKFHEECQLDLIHSSIGEVSENDILLAESFDGMVYCFNVSVSQPVRKLAEAKNVAIKTFNVIYHLVDDLKTEISSRLPPVRDDEVLGEANVLQEFIIKEGKKKVHVAGCKCAKGVLKKDSFCKVIRNDEVVYEGPIISLKHEKSNVETIKKDVECGLRVEDTDFSFLPGDTIVSFTLKYVPQVTKWNPGF